MKRGVTVRVCAVLAVVGGVVAGASPVAFAADGLGVTVVESWGGSLPGVVQPGESVTVLLDFSQSTHLSGVQVPGTSFDVWSDSGTSYEHVRVQCLDPSDGSWVSVQPNNAESWSCSFAQAVTISPGAVYHSGVRFTIDSAAPAGLWNLSDPGIDGVITQVAVPPGELRIPQPPIRSFDFKHGGTVSAPSPTTAPTSARPARETEAAQTSAAAVTSHSTAPATPTSSRPTATPTTSTAPSPSQVASTTAAAAVPTKSSAPALEAVSDAHGNGSSPALFAVVAGLAVLLAGAGGVLYRRRARREETPGSGD